MMQALFDAFAQIFAGRDNADDYQLIVFTDGSGSIRTQCMTMGWPSDEEMVSFTTPEEGVEAIHRHAQMQGIDWYALAKQNTPTLWGQE